MFYLILINNALILNEKKHEGGWQKTKYLQKKKN